MTLSEVFILKTLVIVATFCKVIQADKIATLQQCLGQPLSKFLVTPTQTFSPNYPWSWIKTGFKYSIVTPDPIAVLVVPHINNVTVAIKCAVQAGIQPVARSGGHSYENWSGLPGSLIIDLSLCNHVTSIFPASPGSANYLATFEAGIRLGQLYSDLWNAGQWTISAGTCPYVGVGGHITGGGRGYLTGKYGLAADGITSMTIALANGSVLIANETLHSDLYWAMRGGGSGSFGIVLTFTSRIFQTPVNSVFNINFKFSADFLNIWQATFIPPFLLQNLTVLARYSSDSTYIRGVYLGPLTTLKSWLNLHGIFNQPTFLSVSYDTCTTIGVHAWAASEPPVCKNLIAIKTTTWPENYKDSGDGKSLFMTQIIPNNVITQIYTQLSSSPVYNYVLLESHNGGIMETIPSNATPFPNRKGTLYILDYAIQNKNLNTYYPGSNNFNWAVATESLFYPYSNGRSYYNYVDRYLGSHLAGIKYFGIDNFIRLVQIKNVYDPKNVFYNPQSIPLSLYGLTVSNLSSTFPSAIPSIFPILSSPPSLNPSMKPSVNPSYTPSALPTNSPTFKPSLAPSYPPTVTPSKIPSVLPIIPSALPSITPSITPSLTPSFLPSLTPSFSPSLTPSFSPSLTPSFSPSSTPSNIPTSKPSKKPKPKSTRKPTSEPSNKPSTIPNSEQL